jgi:hypothetical protein
MGKIMPITAMELLLFATEANPKRCRLQQSNEPLGPFQTGKSGWFTVPMRSETYTHTCGLKAQYVKLQIASSYSSISGTGIIRVIFSGPDLMPVLGTVRTDYALRTLEVCMQCTTSTAPHSCYCYYLT